MLNQFKYNIGREIETNIIKAIKTSIKLDAKEGFFSIDGFIVHSVNTFFKDDSLNKFIDYLKLVEQYYIISSKIEKQNETSKIIMDRCSKRLYEIMFLPNYDFKNSSEKDKKRINNYKYQIFKSFNKIFFESIKNKDLTYFKKNIEQLNLIFMGDTADLFPLSESLQDKSNKEKKENFFDENKSQIYYNQTLLGVRYWIYFLYEKEQLNFDLMKNFIDLLDKTKKINTFFWEIEYLFSELNSFKLLELYDWNSWDYEEHEEGVFYSPPDVISWLTKGYAVDSLKNKNISILNVNSNIISDNPNNREILIRILKKDIEEIKNNEKWQKYLGKIDDSNIKSQLEILEFAFISKKAKEIAEAKLDKTLIEEYKKRFLTVWKQNQTIRKIFNYFENKIEYTEDEKLKINGKRVYFENGKVLFIKGKHHVSIHGAEDFGRQMNVDEETYFFNKVCNSKIPIVYNSLIYGIEDSINKIKDFEANAIIIDNSFIYTNGFKNLLVETGGFPKYTYNDIPVFTFNNNSLRKSFIVTNFKKAFTMLYRKNQDLLDEELKVDVYEVPQETLDEKLLSIEDQGLLQEDKENKIMSSVIIDFETIIDFKIENIDAYTVGYIEELIN